MGLSAAQKRARADIKIAALTADFENLWGSHTSKLQGWQTLCADCGVDVGSSITQCRKNLNRVYINLFDLVEARKNGTCPPRQFKSLQQLRNYSTNHGKIFPKASAKQDGFMRVLLKQMF